MPIRALLVAAILAGCGGSAATDTPEWWADADTCDELLAAFEDLPVPDTATGRKEVGDEYRARFVELDCEL